MVKKGGAIFGIQFSYFRKTNVTFVYYITVGNKKHGKMFQNFFFKNLEYSQIWLNFFQDDRHFGYITIII